MVTATTVTTIVIAAAVMTTRKWTKSGPFQPQLPNGPQLFHLELADWAASAFCHPLLDARRSLA